MPSFLTGLGQCEDVRLPSVGFGMRTVARGRLGTVPLVGGRLDLVGLFQDLASLRGRSAVVLVIDNGNIGEFRFEVNMRLRISFNGLLRIPSGRQSKGREKLMDSRR